MLARSGHAIQSQGKELKGLSVGRLNLRNPAAVQRYKLFSTYQLRIITVKTRRWAQTCRAATLKP